VVIVFFQEAWYYDDLDIPDSGEFDEPDADSDYDYEESFSKRKKKKSTPKPTRVSGQPPTFPFSHLSNWLNLIWLSIYSKQIRVEDGKLHTMRSPIQKNHFPVTVSRPRLLILESIHWGGGWY